MFYAVLRRLVILAGIVVSSPALAGAQDAPAVCVPGETTGVGPGEVETAVRLLCQALRERGIPSSRTASTSSASVFRLHLRPLGSIVLLGVVHELGGRPVAEAELRVGQLGDAVVAIPRLLTAVLDGVPIERTATIGGLTNQETRAAEIGEALSQWGFGITGLAVAGEKVTTGYGFDIVFQQSLPRFALIGALSLAFGDGAVYSATVGGRYFLFDGDSSVFLGAHVGLFRVDVTPAGESDFDFEGGGLGARAEIGFELGRFSTARFGFGLHVTAPFFALEREEGDFEEPNERGYYVPLGATAYAMF